nr:EOG090X00TB [Ceriodaphnia reticulata]
MRDSKTQEDLGRIKKTSYYQRNKKPETPTPGEEVKSIVGASSAQSTAAAAASTDTPHKPKWIGFEEGARYQEEGEEEDQQQQQQTPVAAQPTPAEEEAAKLEELNKGLEDEEVPEDEEDIFNTEYVDVVTSGDLKLAYVPDSPTLEAADGDDPFDTSVVEKIVGPLPVIKKKKALVSIGAAVEILTAANEADKHKQQHQASSSSRQRIVQPPTEIQLLCCFDDNEGNQKQEGSSSLAVTPNHIVESSSHQTPQIEEQLAVAATTPDLKDILAEFDVIPENADLSVVEDLVEPPPPPSPPKPTTPKKPELLDEEDFEFEALAYESLAKNPQPFPVEEEEDDPFDTSCVEKVLKKDPVEVVGTRKPPPPSRPAAPPARPPPPPSKAAIAAIAAAIDRPAKNPVGPTANPTVPPLQAQDSFDALFLNDSPTEKKEPGELPADPLVPASISPDPFDTSAIDPFDTSTVDPFDTSAVVPNLIPNPTALPAETQLQLTSFAVIEDSPEDELDPFDTSAPMGSAAINPFAMPTAAPAGPAAGSAVSNPFFDMAPANTGAPASNPFLMDDVPVQSTTATVYNPFAASVPDSAAPVNEHVDSLAWLNSGGAMQMDHSVSPYDLPDASMQHHQLMDDLLEVDIPLPEELSTNLEAATPSPQASPLPEIISTKPDRPTPPPRPPSRPSPPHETQQLILSVTGAMQATSEHLLDRLRAAAPSPVPGYHPPAMHSHSPSPSPSPCPSPTHGHAEMDLLGDHHDDHLAGPPPRPTSRPTSPAVPQRPQMPPARPTPPGPPPRPVASPGHHQPAPPPPADKGFASIFGQPSPTSELEALAFSTPAPAQPAVVEDPPEEIDLLGLPKPRTRTNNDILKLFEKKEEKEKDLLAGDVFGESSFLVDLDQSAPAVAPIAPEASFVMAPSSSLFQEELQQPVPVQTEQDPMVLYQQQQQQAPTLVYSEIKSPVQQSEPIAIPTREAGGLEHNEEFDAFSSRFESVGKEDTLMVESDPFDPFSAGGSAKGSSVWGTASGTPESSSLLGFGASEGFDPFLALTEPPPPPHGSPRFPPTSSHRQLSHDSDEEQPEFALSIKPRSEGFSDGKIGLALAPALAPPPKIPVQTASSDDYSPPKSLNPFLMPEQVPVTTTYEPYVPPERKSTVPRRDSEDSPVTPLFDEDQSVPLEVFPRVEYSGQIWEMQLRQPNKKKITSQRFWKKVFVKLGTHNDLPVIQLYSNKDDKEAFQELQLQPCYSVSDISAQQFDNYGKIFTVKVQYVFYKERPGIRPGQVTKAERLTSRLQQFAAYAIQGDYNGVKEFGSDLRKLGIPVEHAPHISELLKLGTTSYEELKEFSSAIEEALFKLTVPREKSQSGYKTDEVQMTAVDEFYVEQDKMGRVLRQIARVRVFVLSFLSGLPDVELGVNDLPRQGKEVVGRHDIIPVITEEWIRLEDVEFHNCVDQTEFKNTRTVKFRPPDACYIELLRFRVRPPKNRELPLQVRTTFSVSGNKVELKSDVLVPGYISRKYGQIPCEDVAIRFPLPEAWIYMFRVEKHFRYGSVKSSHRRMGKIKGIERFLGAVDTLEPTLIEVTSGSAKYEHHHRAIVWRMPRLPKEGQGSYTTHTFVCRINLTSYDQMPETLARHCFVEFTMPATNVSHTTLRSLAVSTGDPPEKYVRYLARHEYVVEIDHTSGPGPAAYVAATATEAPAQQQQLAPAAEQPELESDSDSD